MERKHGLKEIMDFLIEICPMVGDAENVPAEERRRRIELINDARHAISDLEWLKTLDKCGYLLRLPCKVGDTVYEVLEETVPETYFYIQEYEVQDVSVKAIKYADDWLDWADLDESDAYFAKEAAEAALKRKEEKKNEDRIGK